MDVEGKKVIIYGGLSFLGSSIIRIFLKQPQWKIYVVDKLREGERYPYFVSENRVIPINSSIEDKKSIINQLPRKCDVFIDCVEPFNEMDFIENAGEYISVEEIKNKQDILEKEKQKLNYEEWLSKKIEIKQFIFPICYQDDSLRQMMKKEIRQRWSKNTIIFLPVLFGIFDKVTNFIPNLIISRLLDLNIKSIKVDSKLIYEWLYVDDAALGIIDIIGKHDSKVYFIKGDSYSVKDVNNILFAETKTHPDIMPFIEKENGKKIETISYNGEVIYKYRYYEDIRERLMQTLEFYEDNTKYYHNRLKQMLGEE